MSRVLWPTEIKARIPRPGIRAAQLFFVSFLSFDKFTQCIVCNMKMDELMHGYQLSKPAGMHRTAPSFRLRNLRLEERPGWWEITEEAVGTKKENGGQKSRDVLPSAGIKL